MQTSIAIALAWPETYCKQAGSWYDKPANWLGISKNNYYKVGHSAIMLIEPETRECLYFDFGRYHAPFGRGRVRDIYTDHELSIKTNANLDENLELLNLKDILNEIQLKPECHGDGKVFAGTAKIHFEKAYKRAKHLQEKGSIIYGPFTPFGTNCSRFTRSILCNSVRSGRLKLKLTFIRTLSPTPLGIVKNLKNIQSINKHKDTHLNTIKSECETAT
jgi:hypothetical protein